MNDSIKSFDPRFANLLRDDSKVEKLCSGAEWSEGPVYVEAEQMVIWSDIPNNRLVAWSPDRGFHQHQQPSHFSNGHTIDLQGRIINCEHGRRCISRTNYGGDTEILVSHWNGKRFNSPNDVVVKSDGTIWFSDPTYGILSYEEGYKGESEIGAEHVYRYDPDTGDVSAVATDLTRPNGLAFSPDESLLYISDTSDSHYENGRNEIRVYSVIDGGRRLGDGHVFAEVTPGIPDGFRLDKEGHIFTSSDDSIQVFHPDGTLLGKFILPETVANCTFGGTRFDELYIVASTSLYRVCLNTCADIQRRVAV